MQYGNVIMEHHQPAPSFLVQLLHSVPHINITLHRVNDTFNPNSTVYTEDRDQRCSSECAPTSSATVTFCIGCSSTPSALC
uniref:Protein tweety homolog n=1 Tax=Anopheles arabiensis TaxID=7173 RepID=A0A182HTY3_ANOAR